MKVIYIFIFSFFLLFQFLSAEAQHSWTDLQGRTLQASFIKSDGVTLTIKWNGKIVPIPLATLSPQSQALAKQLSTESSSANPFDSIAPTLSPDTIHPWTDNQGRTLQASFVKANAISVTVKWQGKIVDLPRANLSPASQALATKLSSSVVVSPNPPNPSKTEPVQSTESPKPEIISENPSNGILSLEKEYSWKSTSGTSLMGKFISLEGETLTLSMYNGRSEQTIPIVRLSDDSKKLANDLQALLLKKQKAQKEFANKRKSMKVPSLTEADLTKYHTWVSSEGNQIEALYMAASDNGVTLLMRNNPNRPYELSWDRLSPESQALGEGIRRLKEKLMPKNPAIIPASGGNLARYGNGKWKGYNTVLESAVYDVAIHGNGHVVHIWLKNPGGEGESALGERAKRVPLSVNFRPTYYLNPGERNRQWKHRKIVSFSNPPEVSTEREETTLRGTLDNGATFEYVIQINHRGLSFWGEVDEDKDQEHHTVFSIALYSPNFIPDVANKTMAEIEPLVGDGCLYIDPIESKRAKIPMLDKWNDILTKFTGKSWNPIKSAELMGLPFGSHKIKITPTSTSGMAFHWGKGYSGVFPFQGIHLVHRTQDSYDAARSKTPEDYKKRLEIPKSKRLNVNIIRGRG